MFETLTIFISWQKYSTDSENIVPDAILVLMLLDFKTHYIIFQAS